MTFSDEQKRVIQSLLLIKDNEQRLIAIRTYLQGMAKPLSDAGYDWAYVASEIYKHNELIRIKNSRG